MNNIFLKLILLIFISLIVMGSPVIAQPIAVIVNAKNTENITPNMIKQIYSDKRNFWKNGEGILLFELPVKDKVRSIFSEAILHKSAIASQSDWSNRYVKNTIKNSVKMKPQKLVARFVSINSHAIGYIPASMALKQKNIKIIMTIDE